MGPGTANDVEHRTTRVLAQSHNSEMDHTAPAFAFDCHRFSIAAGAAARTTGKLKTVFLIMMENASWSDIKGNADAPYLNHELLPESSYAEAYKGPLDGNLHPSLPNYIWLEAGDNLGFAMTPHPPAIT